MIGLSNIQHYGALNSLLKELTSVLINTADRACRVIGVCRTSARAIEARPTLTALLTGVCVANAELVLNGGVLNTVPNITETVLLVANKLVAGEELAPRSYSHIFCARTASCNTLIDAGAVLKVDHIVIEGKRTSLLLSLYH